MLRSTLVAIALTFDLLLLATVASARPLSFGVHTPDARCTETPTRWMHSSATSAGA
jgi:hypothetical protein